MPQIGSLFVNLSMNTAQFAQQSQTAAKSLQGIEVNSRKLQFALTNLGFQINDVATGIATGQAPMRIFAQQAGQIVQLFTQGGGFRAVMQGAGQAITNFVTPTKVAVAGLAAVAAGFGVLVARAVEGENRVRAFGVMLKGLGTTGQATAEGLEAAVKRLRDVGLSAAEAKDALDAAQRAGIAPGQAERVVRIGQNLIPVLGKEAPGTLVNAIQGGVQSLGKLALQLGVVSAAEVVAAEEADKLGRGFQYVNEWVTRIEAQARGLNQEALSPLGKQMRDLRIAWSEMLDAMTKTGPIRAAVEALTDLAKIMKAIAEIRLGEGASVLLGAGLGAAIGGRFFGARGALIGGAIGAAGGAYYGARTAQPPVISTPIPGGAGGGAMSTDQALALIEQHESSGRNIKNPKSSASGYWQFLDSTWREIAPQVGIDTTKYPTAMSASRELQRAAAAKLYEQKGFAPWAPYNEKLRADLAGRGITNFGPGGSVMARPEQERETVIARRAEDLKDLEYQTNNQIDAENALSDAIGRTGKTIAEDRANIAATVEIMQRYGRLETEFTPEMKAAQELRAKQFLALSQATGRRQLAEGGQQDRQTTEQLKLQASLFGESTQEIERQVALLRIRQQAEQAGLSVTEESVKKRLDEASALADVNALLAKQQSLMSQIREIAGVFENAFSSAFDAIADGTFKVRKALADLLRDLGKTIASQAFKLLLEGEGGGGGGILGSIGKLFGLGGGGSGGEAGIDYSGGGDFATGGSFRVGGYGAIDSQLVAFRASPGEMVDVTPQGQGYGGGAEVIHISLNPSEGWVAGVADQRIVTHSGTIVDVAVRQSQKTVQRNFAGMSAEAQTRTM